MSNLRIQSMAEIAARLNADLAVERVTASEVASRAASRKLTQAIADSDEINGKIEWLCSQDVVDIEKIIQEMNRYAELDVRANRLRTLIAALFTTKS